MSDILIDFRIRSGSTTGVGRYIEWLLQNLAEIRSPEMQIQILCRPGQADSSNLPQRVLGGVEALANPLGLAQQVLLPRIVKKANCRLFHYTYFDPPWLLPRPFVATCYDIEPLRHPEMFSARIVWYYRIFATGLRRAERIFVISESTGRDLVELLHLAPERVRVTYLGVDSSFRPVDNPEILAVLRARYLLPECYVLYIGNTMPHKNLPRLIEAMARVHQLEPEVALLLAGRRDKYRPAVEQAIATAGLENVVRFLGGIPEEDLPTLFSGAQVFAYPSLYEGFGLPALEAMACGTPVVTSNCSSLPEIVGDSAIVVDPNDSTEIADGILRLLRNPTEAKRFANAGLQRARQFTWRRCAEQHLDLYREVLSESCAPKF